MSEEVHPRADELDGLSVFELLELMNDEDRAAVDAVRTQLGHVARAVDEVAARLGAGGRLHYFGAGSSGRIAELDASECAATFGVAEDVVQAHAVEGGATEDDRDLGIQRARQAGLRRDDVVVAISASGSTGYVLGAVEQAGLDGALRVAVACRSGSPVAKLADIAIEIPTGPEVIAGSTRLKAGTVQKLVLNMLTTATFTRLGRTRRGRMIRLVAGNSKLRERAARIVADLSGVSVEEARRRLDESDGDIDAVLASVRKR